MEDVLELVAGYKVLFVEDDKTTIESLSPMLNEVFDEVIYAEDGEDGYLQFITNDDVDLIITDLNMPSVSGAGMIIQIRKIDLHIPIIVLSAYSNPQHIPDSINKKVVGYLQKPFMFDKFVTLLEQVTLTKSKYKNHA